MKNKVDSTEEWIEFKEWLECYLARYNYKKFPTVKTMHKKLQELNPSYIEADYFDITFKKWLLSFVNSRLEQLNKQLAAYVILKVELDYYKGTN